MCRCKLPNIELVHNSHVTKPRRAQDTIIAVRRGGDKLRLNNMASAHAEQEFGLDPEQVPSFITRTLSKTPFLYWNTLSLLGFADTLEVRCFAAVTD